ncbi:hypothetical protein BG015_001697 [Linnemannia schmuckeri]|uniref:Cytochrome b561 domain-containing protein n=1 Tax=Linnemannia schmuckeri TaxID=64567 RepID=A0A9P5RSZ3_9FUNG|nr:hypothetical protein BG015_001697 [Linnemannia schmuckeri]
MYISTRTARLKATFGFSALLALAALSTVQAQQLCSPQLCITATVFSKESTTIEFSLSAQIDSVGWVGMGIGGQAGGMAGNDLAICWPANTAGTGAIVSQRSATMNGSPSALATPPAFKIQEPKSGFITAATPKRFTCTFSRPLNLVTSPIASTAASVNIIYAVGLRPVVAGAGGNPQKATIQVHTFTGSGSLNIVKKEGTSAGNGTVTKTSAVPGATHTPGSGTGSGGNGGGGSTSPSSEELLRTQEQIDTLIKVHAVMMALAFLIIFPLGASLVRFFCHLEHVFKWHRPVQSIGFLTVLTAFGCILAALAKSSSLNDDAPIVYSTHAIVGFVLVGALVFQVLVGFFIFTKYDPTRTRQAAIVRIPTWVHRCWGYAVLITGIVQVYLGMKLYGLWPTGKEVVWYLYYAWIVVLVVVVFGIGSLLKFWSDKRKDGVVEGERPLKSRGGSDDYLGHGGHDGNGEHGGGRYNGNHGNQGPYELQPHSVQPPHDNDHNRL